MSSNLQQFNISYVPKQDRLLLKIKAGKNTEYRIWLTRRYTSLLIKVLFDRMEAHGGVDAIAVSDEAQAEIKQGAFDKKYDLPQEPDYPLGEEGVLGFQIKANLNKNGNLALQLLPEKGQGLNLNLDKKMLFMLHSILLNVVSGSNWNMKVEPLGVNEIH